MSVWSVRKKEYFTLIGMTLVAILIAAGVLLWGATASLFNPNSINGENYIPYNMQNLVVQTDTTTQGLPGYNISFEYKDSDNKQPENVTAQGFSLLGETLDNLITKEPAVYNIVGTPADAASTSFEFTSSSPSDYTNDVYTKAYSSFIRVTDAGEAKSVQYKSEVQSNGERFVTVKIRLPDSNSSQFAFQNTWSQTLQALPVTDLTTYQVMVTAGDKATVSSAFTTNEEKTALSNIDSNLWATFEAYSDAKGAYNTKFNIQDVTLNLSPVGNNQTTLALTVTPPADRAAFLAEFSGVASQDPKVAWVTAATTTFTAVEELTPFFIQYPSNREW